MLRHWSVRWLASTLVVGALLGFLANRASAQPPDLEQEAGAHFDHAVTLIQSNDLEGAAREFERADAIKPSERVLYNLGQVYAQLNRFADAYRTYQRYLSRHAGAIPAARRALVEEELARLRGKIGFLRVVAHPDSSQVLVEGVEQPEALAGGVPVAPGQQRVMVRADGYSDEDLVVNIEAGDSALVHVSLTPVEPTPETAMSPSPLPPPRSVPPATVLLAPACASDPSTSLPSRWPPKLALGFGIAGVTLGGASVAAYLISDRKLHDLQRDRRSLASAWTATPDDPSLVARSRELDQRATTIERWDAASAVLAGAGTAAVVGSALIWVAHLRGRALGREAMTNRQRVAFAGLVSGPTRTELWWTW